MSCEPNSQLELLVDVREYRVRHRAHSGSILIPKGEIGSAAELAAQLDKKSCLQEWNPIGPGANHVESSRTAQREASRRRYRGVDTNHVLPCWCTSTELCRKVPPLARCDVLVDWAESNLHAPRSFVEVDET